MHPLSNSCCTHCLLDQGHESHLLDVLYLATMNWYNVNEMSIFRCLINLQALPRRMSTGLDATAERFPNVFDDSDPKNVFSKILKHCLEIHARDQLYNQQQKVVDESAAQR